MERFRWLLFEQPRSNYHFHLISNLFSAKFCRTFEITSNGKSNDPDIFRLEFCFDP